MIYFGNYVTDKFHSRTGVVVTIDRKNGIAVMSDKTRYWSEDVKNLERVSDKEVNCYAR